MEAEVGGGGAGGGFSYIRDKDPFEPKDCPDCKSATPSLSVLSPPNGDLVPIDIQVPVTGGGDDASVTFSAVSQWMPTCNEDPNAEIKDNGKKLKLRAVRAHPRTLEGLFYQVHFEAEASGNTCTGTVEVCVPAYEGLSCSAYGLDSTVSQKDDSYCSQGLPYFYRSAETPEQEGQAEKGSQVRARTRKAHGKGHNKRKLHNLEGKGPKKRKLRKDGMKAKRQLRARKANRV